jgi:sirohydrochlorin cobaltochelatase
MKGRALILIAHGSPDPDWAEPLRRVVKTMREHEPDSRVELALLTEPESLGELIDELEAAGHRQVEIVAALLSAGGRHLKRDIPEWVDAQRRLHPALEIVLRPGALGAHPAVIRALALNALDPS